MTPTAARSVEAYWSFVATEKGTSLVLPDGRCDIIVRNTIHAPEHVIPVLTGPATRPYRVTYDAGDQWFGIRLRPEKGGDLWRSDLRGVVDGALRGAPAGAHICEVLHLSGKALSPEILAQAASTSPWPDGDDRLIKATSLLHVSGGRLRIEDLARRVACTPRHLNRLFKKHVGLSAKVYAQLVQFHRTLKLITSGQLSITAAAFEGGYADHAHLTRAFRRFGGFVPSAIPRDLSLPALLPE